MVWSQPDAQPTSPILPPPPNRRNRRSSTSTISTTTTGYDDLTIASDITASHTRAPFPSYAPSESARSYAPSDAARPYAPSESAQSYAPSETTRTYTQPSHSHISPTPQYEDDSPFIPSAQPITPLFPSSVGTAFSISDEPSPLPSPPASIPSLPSSPAQSRRTSSFGSLVRRRRRSSTPGVSVNEELRETPREQPSRQPPRSRGGPSSPRPPPAEEDSLDMSTLLEGIGRMHIAMNQDPAGRWRIKRLENESHESGYY